MFLPMTGIVLAALGALLVGAVIGWLFASRHGVAELAAAKVHGNTVLEISWTSEAIFWHVLWHVSLLESIIIDDALWIELLCVVNSIR